MGLESPSKDDEKHTILYIEDNPANLKLMQQIMARRADIKLLVAPNAEAGIELARMQKPRVILLDINMPRVDGYTALARLRALEATKDIPVIAVSANSTPNDIAKGRQAGFVEYVTKPLNVKRLLDTLDRQLRALADVSI